MKKYLLISFFILLVVNGYSQKAEKLFEQGKEYHNKGEYEKAIKEFSLSIEKENNPVVYAWRGNTYNSLKNYDKALEDYNYAISMSSSPTAWYFSYRASTKFSLEDYSGAIQDYDKSLEIEIKGSIYYERGKAYYRLSKFKEALTDFNKAVELKYDDSKSTWKMYTYWALGDYVNIVIEATKNIANFENEWNYYFRGFSYSFLGKKDEAYSDAKKLIEKYPTLYLGFFLYGNLYLSERKYDLAIKYFEDALKKSPNNINVNHYLSKSYYYKSDFENALKYINQALSIDTTSGVMLFKGRIYYYGLQNIVEANKCFNKVLELEKNQLNSTTSYALLFLGRDEEGISIQKQIVHENETSNNYLTLASFYSILDRETEAIENLEKAFKLGSYQNANILGLTDLDNIKIKKSFRDLLSKYNIPYDLDNKTLIQVYVKSAVNRWQKRGKYEKSEDYLSRVNETNRKKYIESVTHEAIQYVGRMRVEPKIARSEYNPDIETFKLIFVGGQNILVKVPVAEAQSFDANINKMEVTPVFAMTQNDNIIINQISIKNPILNKTYEGKSDIGGSFTTSQLSLDFAPVQTYIDKYKIKEVAQSTNAIESKKLSGVDTNIPQTTRIKEKTFALVIGNEDYSTFQPDLNSEVNVDYAVNDAKVFKEYLNKTLGVPNDNIFLFTNATAGQMKQAINRMEKLAKVYKGEAELIFFFAGHGLPDENSHESYIMPVDISGNTIQYAIKLGDVYQQLSVNPTKRILVFLDACFSGGARNEGLVTLRGVKVRPKDEFVKENMVVYASSSGTQSSMGFDDEQHGLFTYFLLKKLNETKGEVSLEELGKYLETEVNRKSILLKNRDQKPQMLINLGAGSLMLSKKISE